MAQKYGVAFQPLSQHIMVGRLNKAGTEFLDKEVLDFPVIAAVAEYILAHHPEGMDLTVKDAGSGWSITVERIVRAGGSDVG